MTTKEAQNEIYRIIKEVYGDCTSVNILVNSEEIEVSITDRPFTKGYTMKTINGYFLPKKD